MSNLDEAIGARLHQIYDMATSHDWALVGKTIGHRDEVTGRIEEHGHRVKGGWNDEFPELSDGPKKSAAAIKRGRGVVYRRILRQVQDYVSKHWVFPRERKKKLGSVPPHESVTAKCSLCHVHHSKKQHKFHGQGAFHKTHLWGFGMNPKVEYKFRYSSRGRKSHLVYMDGKFYSAYRTHAEAMAAIKWLTEKGVKDKSAIPNSPAEMPLLYGRILQVTGQKTQKHRCDVGCKKVKHRYYHNFKTGPKEWGLPAGAVVLLPSGEQFKIPERSLLIAKNLSR